MSTSFKIVKYPSNVFSLYSAYVKEMAVWHVPISSAKWRNKYPRSQTVWTRQLYCGWLRFIFSYGYVNIDLVFFSPQANISTSWLSVILCYKDQRKNELTHYIEIAFSILTDVHVTNFFIINVLKFSMSQIELVLS